MVKIKYDLQLMKLMPVFENKTGAKVKDCFYDDFETLWFIVNKGEIGKAVGKKGANIRRMEQVLKRKFRVFEFSDKLETFIANLIYPLKIDEITMEGQIVTMKGPDTKTKGLLIGRNAQNLRNYESIIKRYFPIEELKVV